MGRVFIYSVRAATIALLMLAFLQSAEAQFAPSTAPSTPNGSSAAQGAAGQNAGSNFYYAPNYGGGYGGYGGYGDVATPWSAQYGGWITAPTSYWGQDDISRRQATMQGKMQYQDLQLRALQLRQATFNERLYEKTARLTPEFTRDENRERLLARARNVPPRDEIVSGAALNTLLESIQRMRARDPFPGASIALDPVTARHINLTTAEGGKASNGFFTPGNFPAWPTAFASRDFDFDKQRIDANLRAMARAQFLGKIDESRVADSKRVIARFSDALFQSRANLPVNEYAAALEFLTKLSNTVAVMARPDWKALLDATAAKAGTIAELADYMIANGLRFAIATKTFESHYETLFQQLVTYEIGLARLTDQKQSP